MTVYIQKWTPFRLAYEFRTLRQGVLNIGTDAQNKAHLLNLAIAQANAGLGITGWARWRAGFGTNNVSLGSSTTSGAGLLLNVPKVPGFVAPVGTVDDGT